MPELLSSFFALVRVGATDKGVKSSVFHGAFKRWLRGSQCRRGACAVSFVGWAECRQAASADCHWQEHRVTHCFAFLAGWGNLMRAQEAQRQAGSVQASRVTDGRLASCRWDGLAVHQQNKSLAALSHCCLQLLSEGELEQLCLPFV